MNDDCLEVIEGRAPWAIGTGDALLELARWPANCVDLIVADPPYSSGGMIRSDRTNAGTVAKYVNSECAHLEETRTAAFSGDNRDQRSFLAWCAIWLAECARITKEGSFIGVWTDWRQLPSVSDALQAGGFVWQGIGVWDKTKGCRPRMGGLAPQCEYLVWGSMGKLRQQRVYLDGVYHGAIGRERKHVAEKPVALMRDLVRLVPEGGLAFEPFTGTGPLMTAAREAGVRAIGLEIGEAQAAATRSRLAHHAFGASDQLSLSP